MVREKKIWSEDIKENISEKLIMKAYEFANMLLNNNKDTPLTDKFENEKDENGIRKYAQKSERWWDESTGSQKEHLVCWFMRKTYENGSTQKCIDDNFTYKCPKCYFVSSGKRVDCNQEINAKKIFNHMQRPEMYFYIAEAFEILDEKKLSCCINEVKEAKRTGKSWKEIIRKYLPWEKVETKLINRDIN